MYKRLGAPRDNLDGCRKSRPPFGFDPRTFQPAARRYTDNAIPVHKYNNNNKKKKSEGGGGGSRSRIGEEKNWEEEEKLEGEKEILTTTLLTGGLKQKLKKSSDCGADENLFAKLNKFLDSMHTELCALTL